MNVVDNNSNMTQKLAALAASGESVLEEVVEEGQIVMGGMETQQSVVMVTDGTLGNHHFVITDGLDGGTQVIQLDDGNLVMDTRRLKTEPEDLSLREDGEVGVVRLANNREINLDVGAQAIQASAAACVQNVIRGLKNNKSEEDKVSILPDDGLGTLVVEMPSPPKRSKPSEAHLNNTVTSSPGSAGGGGNSHPGTKVSIAKQYSPFGYHCTLEAPTAQWVRKDEDRCTYMNKGQFYGITLEYRPNPTEPVQGLLSNVRSVVMLVFRDAKKPRR